jgi:hypothetical protein
MVTAGRKLRLIAITARLTATLMGLPTAAEAQVGLTSGMAQVALVAYSAPRGSIQGVRQPRELARVGAVSEGSVLVRLSANTGYQLIVRKTGSTTSRIWVRTSTGDFQELTIGSAVIVARGMRAEGECEIRYRIESSDTADIATQSLPVRYEIAINPTL